MNIFKIVDTFFFLIIIMDIFIFLIIFIKGKKNYNYPVKAKRKKAKFAVLIPARDESKVIKGLLESIKNQSYKIPMQDVYIIVENEKDLTCKIAKEFKANIIIRKHLELKRKGYALDEGIKEILKKNKKYDAYFIFDADNILDKDYFFNMLDTYNEGYAIGIGYRNTKNGNENVISACSTLTFSMINTLGNHIKNKNTLNITISGTGFYIKGSYIEKWKGYPFHSLTEDYELTLYSVLNNMTSFYNEKAKFYDEQPTEFKVSLTQRTRWVKGFFSSRKSYLKEIFKKSFTKNKNSGSQAIICLSILPYLLLVFGIILELLTNLLGATFYLFTNIELSKMLLGKSIIILFICYLVLVGATFIILLSEGKKIDLNKKSKIKALFFNPFFLASYVYCIMIACIKKDLGWEKISHG